MRIRIKHCFIAIIAVAICATAVRAQDIIDINKKATQVIPVSLAGLTGEAADVVQFDLAVLGIEIKDPPQYVINGRSDGHVEGSLAIAGTSRPVWNRSYSGGNIRAEAHAFANDIVKELRGTAPIFQSRIAFRLKSGGATEIAVSDYDGFNPIPLTHDGALVATPSWAPGGHTLFYTSWMRSGRVDIYQQNVSTGSRRIFGGYPGSSFNPQVSPDGQRVAMILSKGGSPNLYVCNIDGSGLRQLTHTRSENSSPTWAPNSREICFVCNSGRAQLQKISADGGEPVKLSSSVGGNLTSPDWSPDGNWIAFTSGSRNFNICVMPANGGEARVLADGEDPCWAPNSRTLIFTQNRGEKHVLSLLDVPTKHVKNVRQISGGGSEPAWAR